MSSDWKKQVHQWKSQFPLWKRVVFTIFGYPPMSNQLGDEVWKKWDSRYDRPEYDWKNHSGVKGPPSKPHG